MDSKQIIPVDDTVKAGEECNCEFTPYPSDHDEEESWHFLRRCQHCGNTWYGLHCPHDGYQNPCGKCGARPVPLPE